MRQKERNSPLLVTSVILSLLFISLWGNTYAFAQSLPQFIQTTLEKNHLSAASTGISIADAETHKVIYQHNANTFFIPASNTKLFTAAAALLSLGPSFTFRTRLVYTGNIEKHALNGDVYLIFSGDPSLTINALQALVHQLKSHHVDEIRGNIYLDTHAFSGPNYPLGWMNTDRDYCYGAPATSIILNQNCLHFKLTLQGHEHLITDRDAVARFFHITNQLKFVASQNPQTCTFRPRFPDSSSVVLTGCLPNHKSWPLHLAVRFPEQLALSVIKAQLKKDHIQLTGHISEATALKSTTLLAEHHSSRLATLLKIMLADSNNVYAEAISKAIGLKIKGVGTPKAGVTATIQLLASKSGYAFKGLHLEGGAGGSYYNQTNPQQIVDLLAFIYRTPVLKHYLIPALAVNGRTGTLAYRLSSKPYINRLQGKTGTLSSVSVLSGYLHTHQHHTLIFSIMNQGVQGKLRNARHAQDEIAIYFIRHY